MDYLKSKSQIHAHLLKSGFLLLSSVGNNIIKISFLMKCVCVCVCVCVVEGAIDKYKSNLIIKIYSMLVSDKYY